MSAEGEREERETARVQPRNRKRDAARVPFISILTGPQAGRIFELERSRVKVGRSDTCHLVLEDEGVSRDHALFLVLPDGQVEVRDMASTNGVYVGDELISKRILCDGDRIELGHDVVLRFGYADAEEIALSRRLFEGANFDALTHTLNRGSFLRRMEEELSLCRRQGGDCCFIMFDVDHFKKVNDTHGHPAGDAVLGELGERVRDTIRLEDVLGRLGGEEFGLLLRRVELAGAVAVAEKLLNCVRSQNFRVPSAEGDIDLAVSISLGVSAWDAGLDSAQLMARSDAALYQAKTQGRNRFVVG